MVTFSPVMDGIVKAELAQARFIDASSGLVSLLSIQAREFRTVDRRKVPLVPRRLDPRNFSGEQVVNGIRCFRRVVQCFDSKTRETQDCGYSWYSPDYDFTVTIESFTPSKSGDRTTDLIERYEIQVGVEPDPAMMRIPSDFHFVRAP
jgi:hypothetical protein